MKKIILGSLVLGTLLFGQDVKVAVAANVSSAINDLKKEFNRLNPDTKVLITLGSSGKLTAQIKNGAPYQIFMSANMLYPENLYKSGFAIDKPVIYAKGSLAILSSRPEDFSKGLMILNDRKFRKIAIGNPKTAPYGVAAVQALKNAKIYNKLKKRFVYGESISQTISYTMTAADIGIVAKSSLYSPKMKRFQEGRNWVSVDPKLYKTIDQGVVMLKNVEQDYDSKAFFNFLLSENARTIFEKYGYELSWEMVE